MNNQTDQVAALKEAMLERARRLADEHIAQGNMSRQKILQDAREKIQLLEQKELLLAKTQSEREYLRKVQASEIQLQAELDRNRWGMVQVVVEKIKQHLENLHQDADEYRTYFSSLLKQAAQLINQDDMVAYVNSEDHQRYASQWDNVVPKDITCSIILSDETIDCSGGVKLVSADGNTMVDNTFEGLLARKQGELQKVIFERLFATVGGIGGLTHG